MSAKARLEFGLKYPYAKVELRDWADRAALGVLADLLDRRGVKWELEKVEADVRREMMHSLGDIIRLAHAEFSGSKE